MNKRKDIKAIVIGASAGGLYALKKLVPALPASFPCPVLVVQHLSPHSDNYMVRMLDELSPLVVKEADEKESVVSGLFTSGH